jgi:MFS family permease
MWALIIAAVCAGLFAGALSCGTEVALREFAPSYRLATVMQASLAIGGCVTGLWSAWVLKDAWVMLGAVLLGAVVPFTLIVILPTNRQLLDPALDPHGARAIELLIRWGRLHATRTVLSSIAFVLFLLRLGVA